MNCPDCGGDPAKETMTVERITPLEDGSRIFSGINCHGERVGAFYAADEPVTRVRRANEQ